MQADTEHTYSGNMSMIDYSEITHMPRFMYSDYISILINPHKNGPFGAPMQNGLKKECPCSAQLIQKF